MDIWHEFLSLAFLLLHLPKTLLLSCGFQQPIVQAELVLVWYDCLCLFKSPFCKLWLLFPLLLLGLCLKTCLFTSSTLELTFRVSSRTTVCCFKTASFCLTCVTAFSSVNSGSNCNFWETWLSLIPTTTVFCHESFRLLRLHNYCVPQGHTNRL